MLVGSSIEVIDKQKDVDLFVIYYKNDGFEREIKTLDGIEFDINYIDLETCEDLISKKTVFILKAFNKPKVIMMNDDVENILCYAQKIYKKGPDRLDENYIQFLRFDYSMAIEDINNCRQEKYTFNYMLQSVFHRILKDFFTLFMFYE